MLSTLGVQTEKFSIASTYHYLTQSFASTKSM